MFMNLQCSKLIVQFMKLNSCSSVTCMFAMSEVMGLIPIGWPLRLSLASTEVIVCVGTKGLYRPDKGEEKGLRTHCSCSGLTNFFHSRGPPINQGWEEALATASFSATGSAELAKRSLLFNALKIE